MGKTKTEFELTVMRFGSPTTIVVDNFGVKVLGKEKEVLSYMTPGESEHFAVNILKALKSKKLKTSKQ